MKEVILEILYLFLFIGGMSVVTWLVMLAYKTFIAWALDLWQEYKTYRKNQLINRKNAIALQNYKDAVNKCEHDSSDFNIYNRKAQEVALGEYLRGRG